MLSPHASAHCGPSKPLRLNAGRKRLAFMVCAVIILAGSGVAVGGEGFASLPSLIGWNASDSASSTPSPTPPDRAAVDQDYTTFSHLFAHIPALKQRAAADAKGGGGGRFRNPYRNAAGLSDEQAPALEEIAFDCDRAVAKMDERAWVLVKAFRERAARMQPDEEVPSPPEALKVLQEEKRQTVLSARLRLRGAFGADEFDRLDKFLRQDAGLKVERKPVGGQKL